MLIFFFDFEFSFFEVSTFDSLFTSKISWPISNRHILFSKSYRGTSHLVATQCWFFPADADCCSPVAEHLTAQHSAIKMLHSRVKLVLQYVRAVQAGELPRNHEILREAYSLSHRLPVLQSSRFRADFYNVSLCSTCFCLFYLELIKLAQVAITLTCVQWVLGLNLVWDTSCHDWCFPYVSSVPSGKCFDSNFG